MLLVAPGIWEWLSPLLLGAGGMAAHAVQGVSNGQDVRPFQAQGEGTRFVPMPASCISCPFSAIASKPSLHLDCLRHTVWSHRLCQARRHWLLHAARFP